ncbi:bys1 family [Pyrenophora seminiperda CCB06]|uniref:Bys1 family n=1 Tax=Pyrenophora seminiperda CCB06 TaxID=1302712 RepID=A0A3M7MJD3_9PLEO|nr:bys1 family [Pyrenophora seminiperda CCB06]
MLDYILTVTVLVALTQAKAIVTNNCPFNIYVSSIPYVVGISLVENIPIKSGGQYQEPWRYGSHTNPGIAIKLSSWPNDIMEDADEIDFAYAIDPKDDSKIWVDLSHVRGEPFKVYFHTCRGSFDSTDGGTIQCAATDEVELVVCGTTRSTPSTDTASFEQIKACYEGKHGAKIDEEYPMSSQPVESTSITRKPSSATKHTHFTPSVDRDEYHPIAQKRSDVPECLARVVYYKRSQRGPALPVTSPNDTATMFGIAQNFDTQVENNCDEEATKTGAQQDVYPHVAQDDVKPCFARYCELLGWEAAKCASAETIAREVTEFANIEWDDYFGGSDLCKASAPDEADNKDENKDKIRRLHLIYEFTTALLKKHILELDREAGFDARGRREWRQKAIWPTT